MITQRIYGLFDRTDPERTVRYVGKTSRTLDWRLAQHISAAKRGTPGPVYDWIRSLRRRKPQIVRFETCAGMIPCENWTRLGYQKSAGAAAEVKWIKRFRRDCLNSLESERTKRDWTELTNPVKVGKTS
jgi:hypothetical protein